VDGGTPDGGGDASTDGPSTVQLTVNIAGTTSGKVRITGTGVDRTLTASAVIDVPVGTYTAASETVRADGTYLDSLLDPDAATKPVNVAAGGGSVTVTYAKRPGTGHLWITSSGTRQIVAYSGEQLAQAVSAADGGSVGTPAIVIDNPTVDAGAYMDNPQSVAFDKAGNMWVGNCNLNNLLRYSVADLGASGNPTPDRVVAIGECARAIAFGPTGALAIAGDATPLLLSPSELSQSGTASPHLLAPTDFFIYGDVATFDSAGNVYMTDYKAFSVYRWSAALLAALPTDGGSALPDAVFSGGIFSGPSGVTLMQDGTVLVTAYDSRELVFLPPSQLQSSGNPIPVKRLSLAGNPGLIGPQIPAFDEQGNLWFPDYEGRVVVGFSAAALGTTSADGGVATINGSGVLARPSVLSSPVQAVANPAPSWAPVFTP
jgi:hypothetical protein